MSKNKVKTIDNKVYELHHGGGCCVCDLQLIGINNFVIGEVSECVKLTDSICTKDMGSYFKLKKETK